MKLDFAGFKISMHLWLLWASGFQKASLKSWMFVWAFGLRRREARWKLKQTGPKNQALSIMQFLRDP
jgi:hypothetical protein